MATIRYTYQQLIRKYSDDVGNGIADTDLSPRQRRLCAVMLNLASNTGSTAVYYPPSDETRKQAAHHLLDTIHYGRYLALAMSSGRKAETDFEVAHRRALDILKAL